MAWHDVLLYFLLWWKLLHTVCAILDVDLRTFTNFAYVYGFSARCVWSLCTLCGFPHWFNPFELKFCACCRCPVTQAVPIPLSLPDLWVRLTFLILSNHNRFVRTFIFCGMAWRLTLLLALVETSAYCLRNSGCGFAYVYEFCIRLWIFRTLCMEFVHVVRILLMYTDCAYLYGVYTRCAAFAYVYGFCAHFAAFAYVYVFCLHNVQCGQSLGIQSWGLSKFLLSARAAHGSPSEFLGGFVVGLDRAILPSGVILLCTILLC